MNLATTRNWKAIVRWIAPLVGLVIFIYLCNRIGLANILQPLGKLNLPTLGIVFCIAFVCIVLRAYRWFLFLGRTRDFLKFPEILRYHFVGIYFGFITPGKIGEHGKAVYVNRRCPGLLENLFSTFIDRYVELLGFILVSMTVISYFLFQETDQSLISTFFWWEVGLLVVLLLSWGMSTHLFSLLSILAESMGFSTVADKFTRLRVIMRSIQWRTITLAMLLTLVFWTMQFVMYIIVAKDLDILLAPVIICLGATLAILTVILPASVGGLGTREAALVYVFVSFGG